MNEKKNTERVKKGLIESMLKNGIQCVFAFRRVSTENQWQQYVIYIHEYAVSFNVLPNINFIGATTKKKVENKYNERRAAVNFK